MDQENRRSVREMLEFPLLLAAWLWPFGVVALVCAESCIVRHMEDHMVFFLFIAAPLAILGLLPAHMAFRVGSGARLRLAGLALNLN
jgi:hypothetical protein